MHTNRGFDENTFIFVTAQIVTPNRGHGDFLSPGASACFWVDAVSQRLAYGSEAG